VSEAAETKEAEATKQESLTPKIQKVFEELDEESSNNYSEEFKAMIHTDEWVLNGETFHFQMQTHKRLGEMKKLQNVTLDEVKDWDGYVDNYRQRAKLLIQEMTDEKFDNIPFYDVENLVTAWSIRGRRGFRLRKPGSNNGLPDGSQNQSSV